MDHQHISNELNLSKNPNVIASKMTNERMNEQTRKKKKQQINGTKMWEDNEKLGVVVNLTSNARI